MKKFIKLILKIFGYNILKIQNNHPLSILELSNPFFVQKKIFEKEKHELIIFDVGAYVGKVALEYNNLFTNCLIYSFEPFKESFEKLENNTKKIQNILAYNIGMTNFSGITSFNSNKSPYTNSLLPTDIKADDIWGSKILDTVSKVQVEVTTLDEFMEKNKVNNIDILKLDVQGAEYLVFEGAEKALKSGKIKLIYTEIITQSTYFGQKSMEDIILLLKSYGFELYNLYNLSSTNKGVLRQLDAIFINRNNIKNHFITK